MAMEYGSSPDEQPADQTLMRLLPMRGADDLRERLPLQMFEVMGFPEKLRQVGGDGIDKIDRLLLTFPAV